MALCSNCSAVTPLATNCVSEASGKPVGYCSTSCLDQALTQQLTPTFSRATPSIERVEPGKVRTGDGDADLTEIMISTSDTLPVKSIAQNLGIVDAVIVLKQIASPHQSSSLRGQAIVTDSAFSKS